MAPVVTGWVHQRVKRKLLMLMRVDVTGIGAMSTGGVAQSKVSHELQKSCR